MLTHTHPDHVADLERLRAETGAVIYVSEHESARGAETIAEGERFRVGALHIEARLTSGHSAGGITYFVTGLARPVAVVGDSLFAASMGGGAFPMKTRSTIIWEKILTLPEETILCPGHGPLTTCGKEKRENPFFAGKASFQLAINANSQAGSSRYRAMNIGFVGVGRMGANMARRLKDRGFHVTTLFDVNRAAVDRARAGDLAPPPARRSAMSPPERT